MAMNRYQGNTGRVQRVADVTEPQRGHVQAEGGPPPPQKLQNFYQPRPLPFAPNIKLPRFLSGGSHGSLGILSEIEDSLGGLISRFVQMDLETEDLILLMIIWLMYKESGDEELLYIMGLMLLL
ncbi:MAG: hypothetical protein AB7D36_02810 [Oscillospiraceae bacterium]